MLRRFPFSYIFQRIINCIAVILVTTKRSNCSRCMPRPNTVHILSGLIKSTHTHIQMTVFRLVSLCSPATLHSSLPFHLSLFQFPFPLYLSLSATRSLSFPLSRSMPLTLFPSPSLSLYLYLSLSLSFSPSLALYFSLSLSLTITFPFLSLSLSLSCIHSILSLT